MKKIKSFERKFYASVLVYLLIVISFSSTSSLTLRFDDDPDTPDQDSHMGSFICNQSGDDYYLYGHNATTEDLYLYANNVDANPYVILEGNDDITLQSGDDVFIGGYLGPFINLTNGDDILLDAVDDIIFYDNAAEMFKFELSGDDSIMYGATGATDDVFIYATSGDPSTYIYLEGSDDLWLYSDKGIKLVPDSNEDVLIYNGDIQFSATSNRTIFTYAANVTIGNGGQDVTTIKDILQLNPISSVSTTPVEGMIYYDSDNSTLCCWTGSGWKGFW